MSEDELTFFHLPDPSNVFMVCVCACVGACVYFARTCRGAYHPAPNRPTNRPTDDSTFVLLSLVP